MKKAGKSKAALHSPTLESVLMVEKLIKRHSGELGKYQSWKKLPKKMMYQTFCLILDYLEKSNKTAMKDKKIVWISSPAISKPVPEPSPLYAEPTSSYIG
jgi:hypothetical protein